METNLTSNKSLLDWLDEKVELLKPSNIVWIDGSKEQIDALKKEAVETGEMIKLNDELLPDCYLHRTGWLLISATRCFMTSQQALMKAEQCISFLIQWAL